MRTTCGSSVADVSTGSTHVKTLSLALPYSARSSVPLTLVIPGTCASTRPTGFVTDAAPWSITDAIDGAVDVSGSSICVAASLITPFSTVVAAQPNRRASGPVPAVYAVTASPTTDV